jgi:hypothetical protein
MSEAEVAMAQVMRLERAAAPHGSKSTGKPKSDQHSNQQAA